MSVRILHLADLHLGAAFPSMGERAQERTRDLLNAFLRAIEFASSPKHPVDLVAIAGDLFDTHDPDEGLVFQVESSFERLSKAKVPVFLVPGTHDAYSYRRSVYRRLRLPEGSALLAEPRLQPGARLTIRGETVQMYGVAYDPAVAARPLGDFSRSGTADYHVGILHGALQDSPTWKIRPSDLPINRGEVAACGLHYLALGHYHNFVEVREGGSVAVYPGTLEGRKFGEDGPRHLLIVTLSRGTVSIERKPWNTRTLSQVAVEFVGADVHDEHQLIDRIAAFAGDGEIVRVRLEGAADFVFEPERIAARIRDRFFHLEIDDHTYLLDAALLGRFRDEATIRGAFVRRTLERLSRAQTQQEKEIATLALRIGLAEFQNPRHAV
ncbi:MAG: DNA repair exonuclease [Candidatus Eisenbacteria bacterium]|uniref:DNA repair exonuclease n=1 Tax=Eiseniibacteriota bacterium TaxID=2212470 RepID=A0A538T4Y6_UNCEI|nr:MAG: DNA repair exonuclease [Candidatus Eisenbacteria bacterium]